MQLRRLLMVGIWLGLLIAGQGRADSWQTPSPIQVLFWHHLADDPRAQFWQTLADEFNAQQQGRIEVQVQYFPSYAQQHEAILNALVRGGLPDAALLYGDEAALYQLSQSLLPLGNESESPLLLLPLTRSAEALYINRSALANLGYNNTPQTRQEWSEMACAYHAATGQPAFDLPLKAAFWQALSADLFFDPTTGFQFDNPDLIGSLEWARALLAQGCAAITPQGGSAQNRFASQQTLFYAESSAARPYVEAAIGTYLAEPFAMQLAPIPSATGPVSYWTTQGVSLFRSGPEREAAAWEWLRWLAEPAQVERWAEVNAALPALDNAPMSAEWQAFEAAIALLPPPLAGYDIIRDEMSLALRAILAGEDQNTSLQNLTQTANRVWQAFAVE
jgi:ABC-type glycerol-3-phosphate transport system substrate-binding protein